MANETSTPVTVYGNWATLQILEGQPAPGQARGRRSVAVVKAEREWRKEFEAANDGKAEVTIESEPSDSLGDNWINCMRTREAPVYNALRGYQVMVAIALGVESYRKGRVMAFDPARRKMLSAPVPHKEYPPPEA
jgi:hypothetical protein